MTSLDQLIAKYDRENEAAIAKFKAEMHEESKKIARELTTIFILTFAGMAGVCAVILAVLQLFT